MEWSVWPQNNQVVALQTEVHYIPSKASEPAVSSAWGDMYIYLLPIHLRVLRMSSDAQESTLELYFEVPYPTHPQKNLGIDRYWFKLSLTS